MHIFNMNYMYHIIFIFHPFKSYLGIINILPDIYHDTNLFTRVNTIRPILKVFVSKGNNIEDQRNR